MGNDRKKQNVWVYYNSMSLANLDNTIDPVNLSTLTTKSLQYTSVTGSSPYITLNCRATIDVTFVEGQKQDLTLYFTDPLTNTNMVLPSYFIGAVLTTQWNDTMILAYSITQAYSDHIIVRAKADADFSGTLYINMIVWGT